MIQIKKQQAIKFGAVNYVLFGLLSALSAWLPFTALSEFLTQIIFLQFDGSISTQAQETRISNAILGGITVGWGVLIWIVVDTFYDQFPRQIERALLISVTSWFAVDGLGSIAAGGWFNVILNISFWVLVCGPVLLIKEKKQAQTA